VKPSRRSKDLRLRVDPLVSAWLRQHIADLTSNTVAADDTLKSTDRCCPPELQPFIDSGGDVTTLYPILTRHPLLLRHPIVWDQLQHLFHLSGSDPEAWLRFKGLVEAWARGVLPGWSLAPPSSPRGRRSDPETLEAGGLILSDYETLLTAFKRHPLNRHSTKSDLEAIVFSVWSESSVSLIFSPRRKRNGSGRRVLIPRRLELPPDRVSEWVKAAVNLAAEALPIRDYLAYCLVGYRWPLPEGRPRKPDEIRGIVQRVRKRLNLA
jgi:hypothetical protein